MESIGSLLGTSSCDTKQLLQCIKALIEVRGMAMMGKGWGHDGGEDNGDKWR